MKISTQQVRQAKEKFMKSGISFLFLSFILAYGQNSFAQNWIARLTCEGSAFVVDGNHSFEKGFLTHQAVIRDSRVIQYFESLVHSPFPLNQSGELILPIKSTSFNGSFDSIVFDIQDPKSYSAGREIEIHGHWIDAGRYELYLTSFYHYPGMTYYAPIFLGKWVFNNCSWIQ
jgi:hypothetical protein